MASTLRRRSETIGRSACRCAQVSQVAQLALDDGDRLGNFGGAAIEMTDAPLLQRAQVDADDAGDLAGLHGRRHAQVDDDQRPSGAAAGGGRRGPPG